MFESGLRGLTALLPGTNLRKTEQVPLLLSLLLIYLLSSYTCNTPKPTAITNLAAGHQSPQTGTGNALLVISASFYSYGCHTGHFPALPTESLYLRANCHRMLTNRRKMEDVPLCLL
jgi:hypothetical protein